MIRKKMFGQFTAFFNGTHGPPAQAPQGEVLE